MSKKRPILFSAPMVRALLDGSKTQTRRMVKPQPAPNHPHDGGTSWVFDMYENGLHVPVGSIGHLTVKEKTGLRCPYGKPGDRLWVKETWWHDDEDNAIIYRADPDANIVDGNKCQTGLARYNWRPSIFMPRWASRITLEITRVRVEQLHDISEVDAKSEGAPFELGTLESTILGAKAKYRSGYCRLWESINGPGSWDLNPWVWVIEFKRVPS